MKTAEPSYWSTDEFARSTASAASGGEVVIQLGTNDAWPHNWPHHETFLSDCKALVEHYRAAPGKPRVWVALIPPGAGGDVIGKEVIPLLRRCAKETDAPTIDVYGAMQPHPNYLMDGVHPNDDGAALIARTVRDAIVLGPTPTERVTHAGKHIALFGAFAAAMSALASRRKRPSPP
jgi:acyl-CoA thioesterase I